MDQKIRISGYVRLSRDDNKENYSSIENQKVIIRNHAKDLGLGEISEDDFYEDDGYSGYSFDRPAFNILLNNLEKDKIDIVIAKDLSRIGRHNAYTLLFLENIKNMGKKLLLVDDNYDTSKDNDEIIGIKTWMNERYVKDSSKKIKQVVKSKQREGKFVCAVPYGYLLNPVIKNKIEVDRESSIYISQIFDMYVNGDGYRKIANTLTEKQVPTPSMIAKKHKEDMGLGYKKDVTTEWSQKMVMLIIRNDFYTGTLRQGKQQLKSINGKPIKVKNEDQFIFENNHESLVSKEIFNLAQNIVLKRNINNYRGQPVHKNLYSGFLVCADCGTGLVALNKEGKQKSYICGRYNKMGKIGCSTHYVLDGKINRKIKTHLKLCRDILMDVIVAENKNVEQSIKTKANYNSTTSKLNQDLLISKDELKILMTQKIKELSKNPDMEEIISQTYDDLQREKMERIKILQTQIEDFKNISEKTAEIKSNLKTALEIFNDIINKEAIEKKDLELIIEKIIVFENGKLQILFKNGIDFLVGDSKGECEIEEELEVDEVLQSAFYGMLKDEKKTVSKTYFQRLVKVGNRKASEIIEKFLKCRIITENDPSLKTLQTPYKVMIEKLDESDARVQAFLKDQNNSITDMDKAGALIGHNVPFDLVIAISNWVINIKDKIKAMRAS